MKPQLSLNLVLLIIFFLIYLGQPVFESLQCGEVAQCSCMRSRGILSCVWFKYCPDPDNHVSVSQKDHVPWGMGFWARLGSLLFSVLSSALGLPYQWLESSAPYVSDHQDHAAKISRTEVSQKPCPFAYLVLKSSSVSIAFMSVSKFL